MDERPPPKHPPQLPAQLPAKAEETFRTGANLARFIHSLDIISHMVRGCQQLAAGGMNYAFNNGSWP